MDAKKHCTMSLPTGDKSKKTNHPNAPPADVQNIIFPRMWKTKQNEAHAKKDQTHPM
jgi:hypothetical protein